LAANGSEPMHDRAGDDEAGTGRGIPALPVVWRPRRTSIVAYTVAAVMIVGSIVLALLLPHIFHLPDRLGVVAFGCLVALILHLLGRCKVTADERGVVLVNALRTRRYEWPELIDVTLTEGEPWPKLDLADGSSVGAMGIQGSEKRRAAQAVAELKALIHARGEAPDPR
jgi:Protein of unknown function (DUF2581).